jgi:chromosome segregation ATPase
MATEKEQEKHVGVGGEGGDTESLRSENETLAGEVKARGAAILKLEQALAAKESEIITLKKELAELKLALDGLAAEIPRAVAAYKEMIVQADPGILPELITGDTIEEVKDSVRNARAVMDRVRQEMEAEAAKTRIPAGAPPRAPLDLSGLSAREKIQHGLGSS